MSKKIGLLVDCLSSGGAEKLAANSSILLKNEGYQVVIITMQNRIDYNFAGEIFNVGVLKEKYNMFKVFWEFRKYFLNHHFDFIIDHRVRDKYIKELLFAKWVFKNKKVIYYIHNYDLYYSFSFLNCPKLARWPHVKDKRFISVSKGIKGHLKDRLSLDSKVIYNYIPKELARCNSIKDKDDYIIAVGRLTDIKQFDKLIQSYQESKLPGKNVKLFILGDGEKKEALFNLAKELGLTELVKFIPFKSNPYDLMIHAKALVMSSQVEGFPMVLLEALALGTPVISFDCSSGPSEIIESGINGLLVENQNGKALTKAMDKLILDTVYYEKIKQGTSYNLDAFSENKYIQNLVNILEVQR